MTTTNPNTPTPDSKSETAEPAAQDRIQPWLIFGFVLAVLVTVVAAVAIGVDNDQLTAITIATVSIVGAAVAAFKARR